MILGIVLALMLQSSAFAQMEKGVESREAAFKACEEIVGHFGNGASDLAFYELLKIWNMGESEFEEFKQGFQETIPKIMDRFGTPIGSVMVKDELIEGLLYRVSCAIKHETYGMQMLFTFYKGKGDEWYLSNISWNDKLSELFEH